MPTALPESSEFTGGSVTEGQQKTWIYNLRTFLADLLGTTGTVGTALAKLGVIFGAGTAAKSGVYTVVAADRGKTLNCTGTWTLSLTAAATLGDGFAATVINSGSGVITIDPSGSETIDGATTLIVAAGASRVIVCTGSAWVTVGGGVAANSIDGTHIKPLSAMPVLTVSASDAQNIYPGLSDYTYYAGSANTSSTTYVPIYEYTMTRATGTVRAKCEHRSNNSSRTSSLRLMKNGVQVQEWTTTSTTTVERSVDVSISVSDVLAWQTKISNADSLSMLSSPRFFASNTYVQNTPYKAAV